MNGDGVDEYERQLFGMASPEGQAAWIQRDAARNRRQARVAYVAFVAVFVWALVTR